MIDRKQIQKIKQETLAMKSVNDWLNQIEKIGVKRGGMGMNTPFSPPVEQDTIVDKFTKLLEKKQEMEMMSNLMSDWVGNKTKDAEPKKETPQSKMMGAIAELMKSNPEAAQQMIEKLDDDALSKLAFLSNPDPNAALIRSIVQGKGNSKSDKSNSMLEMLQVFEALNKLNKDKPVKEDPNKMVLEILKLMISQNQNKNENKQDSSVLMMQEFLRNEREARLEAQKNAEIARQEMNNTMIRYLEEKRLEAQSRPSAVDEMVHMLGALGQVKSGFGDVLGTATVDKEMHKLNLENERWRFEKELDREQRNTMMNMITGITDKIADVATKPLGEELKAQFAQRAKEVGQNLVTLDNTHVADPVQDKTIEDINDEVIPQQGAKNFVVYGESEK